MLNPDIQIETAAEDLARQGRVRVASVLKDSAAQALHRCLDQEVPWTLALRSEEKSRTIDAATYAAMDDRQRGQLVEKAAAQAGSGFAFAYESYQMVTSYMAQRDPGLLLHRMVEYLNSPEFLRFAVRLTGDTRIRKADCQATCYRSGHFLTAHDDRYEDEGRLYAYVLGLTRDWRADWGGLLHFLDAGDDVVETYLPRYNALTVFRVPVYHCVSCVAPYAALPRYSITGWWRSA